VISQQVSGKSRRFRVCEFRHMEMRLAGTRKRALRLEIDHADP